VVGSWGRARALSVAFAWRALTLAVAAVATSFLPALLGFLLQEIGLGFNEPVQQAWLNEHAASGQRATVLSVGAMAFTLGGATGLVCLGWLARETSIATAWLVSAALCAAAAPGYLAVGRVARRQAPEALEPLRARA
jgi:MFS family permease